MDPETLLSRISEIAAEQKPRMDRLQRVAATLGQSAGYRWVGLYAVDVTAGEVIGTIDVESERPNAFDKDTEELLEDCAVLLQPLFAET